MQFVRIAVVALSVFAVEAVARANDHWDYPAGRSGVNQVEAGRAGSLRVYDCETQDSVETVLLWYAERLGLGDDHRLFVAASKGLDGLGKDMHFQHGFGHDTDERRDHTQMVAHVRGGHAHVTFLHRPDYRLSSTVTISIAETPDGTSVHVIQPRSLPAKRGENAGKSSTTSR